MLGGQHTDLLHHGRSKRKQFLCAGCFIQHIMLGLWVCFPQEGKRLECTNDPAGD